MFTLRLLGGLALETEHEQRVGRAAQKLRLAVLAVLASRPGVAVTRDKLLALFWPESSNEDARHRLSAALYDLRRALGEDVFAGRGDELSIPVGAIRCDVVEFEAAIENSDWLTATQLYRGPFLDGVHIDDAPEFEEWVEQRRTQLARSHSKALEEWARLCTARSDHAAAVEAWQRLADAEPLNDRLALGLMKAFEAAGNRAGALLYAKLHEQRLRDDVGVEPDQALRAYAASLRTASVVALAAIGSRVEVSPPIEANAILPGAPNDDVTARVILKRRSLSRRMASVLALFLLLPAVLSVLPEQPEAHSAPAVSVATTAVAAMREGDDFLRAGRFESAVAAFERAVSLDSSAAQAHFQLAVATLWADQPGDKIDSRIAAAVARRDGLDELNRMLLDGFIAWRSGEWHQAEEVYRRALTTYPASTNARQELGEVLFHYGAPQGRSLDEARLEFERVLEREPHHYGALWHLAQIAARDHRVSDVDRLTAQLLALEPDVVRTIEVEALRAAVLDDERAFDRVIDRLRDGDESLLFGVGWRLAVSGRDLDAAERVFNLLTDARRAPNAQGLGHVQLFYLQLARGFNDGVVHKLQKLAGLQYGGAGIELLALLTAIASPAEFPASFLVTARDSLSVTVSREGFQTAPAHDRFRRLATLGALHAVLGDSARASAIVNRLDAESAGTPQQQQCEGHAAMIRALIARNERRHADVVRWTERGLVYRWFGHAIFDPFSAYSIVRFIRAEALVALGRSAEADAWFATIGDHDPSDLAFLPAALEHRQRIAKARGDGAGAARVAAQLQALRAR